MGQQALAAMGVDVEIGGRQSCRKALEKSAQGQGRLLAAGPEYAALGPEAEPVEAQFERLGADTLGNCKQSGQLRRGHRTDEGQRQVQGLRAQRTAAG